jgi:sugar lactone lactonase YvrE
MDQLNLRCTAYASILLLTACSMASSPTPGVPSSLPAAGATVAKPASPYKIYVANAGVEGSGPSSITIYEADGTPTGPAITDGVSSPFGIAVDLNGKVYVTNVGTGELTTYASNGKRTPLTITGLHVPRGVAVDASGKIYVASFADGTVTTYTAKGKPTTPTIAGLSDPVGVAVDSSGKIFVTSSSTNTLMTFTSDGTRTTPTITKNLSNPLFVAVDGRGKIYVTNQTDGILTTYKSNGQPVSPSIESGLVTPRGVAVDANGKIFVANFGHYAALGQDSIPNSIASFRPSGKQTTLTITSGVAGPLGIALH